MPSAWPTAMATDFMEVTPLAVVEAYDQSDKICMIVIDLPLPPNLGKVSKIPHFCIGKVSKIPCFCIGKKLFYSHFNLGKV